MKVSVITPVWNQCYLTGRFLAQNCGVYDKSNNKSVEWVIIDNGSVDDTPHVLDVWQEIMGNNLKVMRLEENTGFGPGNNRGAEVATGDIFCFLSNDVQIEGDYISLAQKAVGNNPQALYGPEIFSHDTGWNNFNATGPIPYVAGWCVIAHKDLWAKIGPWDERYIPCDYEDMDLSFYASKQGYPLIKVDMPLKHDSGKSAEQLPGGRLKITLKNQARFRKKWGL